MTICLSHAGTATYNSSSPSEKLLIGTADGVYILQREDLGQWRLTEKSLDGCHVSTLFVHLTQALKEKCIAGAVLDALPRPPLPPDSELCAFLT